jgi:hypothetical protein
MLKHVLLMKKSSPATTPLLCGLLFSELEEDNDKERKEIC